MCLCGLSDCDRKVAHGELVGMQVLMEDVLLGSYHVTMEGSPEQQATLDKAQVTTEGSPERQATLDKAHVTTEGSPEWQATPDKAQVFLASGLQTWPVLCCTEGFAYFESQTRGSILHSCSQ